MPPTWTAITRKTTATPIAEEEADRILNLIFFLRSSQKMSLSLLLPLLPIQSRFLANKGECHSLAHSLKSPPPLSRRPQNRHLETDLQGRRKRRFDLNRQSILFQTLWKMEGNAVVEATFEKVSLIATFRILWTVWEQSTAKCAFVLENFLLTHLPLLSLASTTNSVSVSRHVSFSVMLMFPSSSWNPTGSPPDLLLFWSHASQSCQKIWIGLKGSYLK